MSITAFPVLCRILTECKLLDTTVGVVVLSAGVGNDVVGWVVSICRLHLPNFLPLESTLSQLPSSTVACSYSRPRQRCGRSRRIGPHSSLHSPLRHRMDSHAHLPNQVGLQMARHQNREYRGRSSFSLDDVSAYTKSRPKLALHSWSDHRFPFHQDLDFFPRVRLRFRHRYHWSPSHLWWIPERVRYHHLIIP